MKTDESILDQLFSANSSADLRRFHKEVEVAEADIRKFKEEKKMKLAEKEGEKKRDLEMLKSYDPWGRPGAGAPNVSRKIQYTGTVSSLDFY